MALITCPECGRQVSDAASTCPTCGYPIKSITNDVIRIKIDNNPSVPGAYVRIFELGTNELLANVPSGSVAEIKSAQEKQIYFCGLTKTPMLVAKVSPQNGGKYRATWGPGMFSPRIISCSRVDVIDS